MKLVVLMLVEMERCFNLMWCLVGTWIDVVVASSMDVAEACLNRERQHIGTGVRPNWMPWTRSAFEPMTEMKTASRHIIELHQTGRLMGYMTKISTRS